MFPQLPFSFQQNIIIGIGVGSQSATVATTSGNAIPVYFGSGVGSQSATVASELGQINPIYNGTAIGLQYALVSQEVGNAVPIYNGDAIGTQSAKVALEYTYYNDNFANRFILVGLPVTRTANNNLATGEVGEPVISGAIESLWWEWTSPSTRTTQFNTIGSSFDTYLAVYSGDPTSVSTLTLLGTDDDSGGSATSLLNLSTTASTIYYIRVEGFNSNKGNIVLNIL